MDLRYTDQMKLVDRLIPLLFQFYSGEIYPIWYPYRLYSEYLLLFVKINATVYLLG